MLGTGCALDIDWSLFVLNGGIIWFGVFYIVGRRALRLLSPLRFWFECLLWALFACRLNALFNFVFIGS